MPVLPFPSALFRAIQDAPRKDLPVVSGSVDASLTSAQANVDTMAYFLSARLERRTRTAGLTLSGLYAYTQQKENGDSSVTEDRARLTATYDFPRRSRVFGTFTQRAEKDGVNDLALRLFTSVALGIQLQESGDVVAEGKITRARGVSWTVNLGVSNLYERYSNGSGTTNKPGLSFGSNYRARPARGFRITHDFILTPAFEDLSDYYLSSDLRLNLQIAGPYQVGFQFLYDFDRTPANGVPPVTRKYALTLGYSF